MNTALGSFYDAAQIALRLKYVSEEKLVQWAEAGYVPSYYIDECGPLFKIAEVVAWMKANAIRQRGGLEFPKRLVVVGKNPGAVSAPEALQHIDGLRSLNPGVEQLCGIYFLCLDNEVVYVGQSICVVMRVLTHMNQTKDKKMFDHDRVFFLSVPREALDKMEREFIRALKPRYNLNGGGTGRRWEGDGCTV